MYSWLHLHLDPTPPYLLIYNLIRFIFFYQRYIKFEEWNNVMCSPIDCLKNKSDQAHFLKIKFRNILREHVFAIKHYIQLNYDNLVSFFTLCMPLACLLKDTACTQKTPNEQGICLRNVEKWPTESLPVDGSWLRRQYICRSRTNFRKVSTGDRSIVEHALSVEVTRKWIGKVQSMILMDKRLFEKQ